MATKLPTLIKQVLALSMSFVGRLFVLLLRNIATKKYHLWSNFQCEIFSTTPAVNTVQSGSNLRVWSPS